MMTEKEKIEHDIEKFKEAMRCLSRDVKKYEEGVKILIELALEKNPCAIHAIYILQEIGNEGSLFILNYDMIDIKDLRHYVTPSGEFKDGELRKLIHDAWKLIWEEKFEELHAFSLPTLYERENFSFWINDKHYKINTQGVISFKIEEDLDSIRSFLEGYKNVGGRSI